MRHYLSLRLLAALALVHFAATTASARLDAQQIAPGIYVGRAPRTAADYRQLECLNIKTVVEMRVWFKHKIAREQQRVLALGLDYSHIPVPFRPQRTDSPEQVLALVSDPQMQPVYIHCNLGRDRTGLIAAIYRVRYEGWSPGAAFQRMREEQFNPLLKSLDRYFWDHAWPEFTPAEAAQPAVEGP